MTRSAASEAQIRAADPGASTWLSANAGSGKTRVLTDRVARLLLEGAEPQRILCLTYTKAAASEMQNRLFQRLGDWAMLEEGALRHALAELGIEGAIDADTLARARRLFARAIETPGGLKIQTIHAFCASLLRRFPLEAGVTPAFAEMDDRRAALLREEVVDALAESHTHVVDGVAQFLTDEDFSALCAAITGQRARFDPPLDAEGVWHAFGLAPGDDAQALLAEVFLGGEGAWLSDVITVMRGGTKTDIKDADRLALLSLDAPTIADVEGLEDIFLFKSGEQAFTAKFDKFPTKATRAALGPLMNRLEDLMRRVEAARPRRLAQKAARRTAALHRFAGLFLPEYEARKAALGWLDFDDLILRTQALLTHPSVAQWVLFRLDGGIDHILVDEAQDTSPAQWQVVERLTQEFTAGQGARGQGRTIFVVGDKKQSIYSFQGADLRAFDQMHDQFAAGLRAAGTGMQSLTLDYSFRSSDAVLRLVDLTFDEGRGAGLGGASKHLAFHAAMPGRVDLWPVVEPVSNPEDGDWTDPVDLVSDRHHTAILAQRIADEITRMLAAGTQVPTDGKGGARAMTAGDVLILVQRRGPLFHEIIRACKAAGLPIAGADRLRLGAELAVRDLRALLCFLATPEDSLSLAAALRSPLFGWSEGQLFNLAQGRKPRFLWEEFRRRSDEFPTEAAMLDDLRGQSDYLRPYELLERVLTRHGGRGRLISRLGTEAEDGIDELLNQALSYEQLDVPSLTGFLGWLDADDVEVKRQPDSAGGRIRVMTVHGAKGLEAPVVFLPDTADRNPPRSGTLFNLGETSIGWTTPAAESPPVIAAAQAQARTRQEEENQRLLYVALTRARSWLIVCAAGKVGKETAWYEMVRAGMGAANAVLENVSVPSEFGPIQRLQHGDWPADTPDAGAVEEVERTDLPDWATRPTPEAPEPARPLSPSSLGGAKALPGEGLPEAEAKLRGTLLHRLLEHLPLWPEAERDAMARDLLASGSDPVAESEMTDLLAEAQAILGAQDLAPIFAPGTLAEVGITAELGGQRIFGIIDRLVIGSDRILAVDYKSNATLPATAEQVPGGILRQMGAYARALEQVYPGHRIETAILWTREARLMPLPDALIMAALREAGFP